MPLQPYQSAIIGVVVPVSVCLIALIIVGIIFCKYRYKEDTNVRKRIITKNAFEKPRPEPVREPEPEPLPQPYQRPMPVPLPMPLPPLPPVPQRPVEPKVIVRDIHHHHDCERSRDDDDYILVKTKRRHGRNHLRVVKSDCSDSSSSSSSDDEQCRDGTRPNNYCMRPAVVPMGFNAPGRLNALGMYSTPASGQQAVVNMVPGNAGAGGRPFQDTNQQGFVAYRPQF